MKDFPRWTVVTPMANEGADFAPFIAALNCTMDALGSGHVILVVDRVSKDNTRELAEECAKADPRYTCLWEPSTRNVVDAYLAGFRLALEIGFEWIVEMDAGMSHDPAAVPQFLAALAEGNDCVFGSRFLPGGSMVDSPPSRKFLSEAGTIAAKVLLGSKGTDMTSGYEAFTRDVLSQLVDFPLISTAHFYQTEVRYLLRNRRWVEIPIHYRAPSPRVSRGAIKNSFHALGHYTKLRLTRKAPSL